MKLNDLGQEMKGVVAENRNLNYEKFQAKTEQSRKNGHSNFYPRTKWALTLDLTMLVELSHEDKELGKKSLGQNGQNS